MLGSIDANRGNPQNGWDTDQFPADMYDCVEAMAVVLQNGGLHSGGLNFDAKVRRESTDLEDLFIAHIGGMDAFARGLRDRRPHAPERQARRLQGRALRELRLGPRQGVRRRQARA